MESHSQVRRAARGRMVRLGRLREPGVGCPNAQLTIRASYVASKGFWTKLSSRARGRMNRVKTTSCTYRHLPPMSALVVHADILAVNLPTTGHSSWSPSHANCGGNSLLAVSICVINIAKTFPATLVLYPSWKKVFLIGALALRLQ